MPRCDPVIVGTRNPPSRPTLLQHRDLHGSDEQEPLPLPLVVEDVWVLVEFEREVSALGKLDDRPHVLLVSHAATLRRLAASPHIRLFGETNVALRTAKEAGSCEAHILHAYRGRVNTETDRITDPETPATAKARIRRERWDRANSQFWHQPEASPSTAIRRADEIRRDEKTDRSGTGIPRTVADDGVS